LDTLLVLLGEMVGLKKRLCLIEAQIS